MTVVDTGEQPPQYLGGQVGFERVDDGAGPREGHPDGGRARIGAQGGQRGADRMDGLAQVSPIVEPGLIEPCRAVGADRGGVSCHGCYLLGGLASGWSRSGGLRAGPGETVISPSPTPTRPRYGRGGNYFFFLPFLLFFLAI